MRLMLIPAALTTVLAATLALAGIVRDVEPRGMQVELPDSVDCDGRERIRRRVPDCGYRRDGFHPWSWVAAGRTTPPPGWSAVSEWCAAYEVRQVHVVPADVRVAAAT